MDIKLKLPKNTTSVDFKIDTSKITKNMKDQLQEINLNH